MLLHRIIRGQVHVSSLTLAIAGFAGCVFCLAWDAFYYRHRPAQPTQSVVRSASPHFRHREP